MPTAARPAATRSGPEDERGFVLLVVLAALGLLALVAASFAQVARSHIRLAAVASESAKAEALADAGAHMAILDLVAARGSPRGPLSPRRFALDATPLGCRIPGAGTLVIAVQDEAGKVDLNIASPPLLRALVLGTGVSGGEAAVDAVLDFRDDDDDRRVSGAERAEYEAAGRPYGPRNGPFLAVEELAAVLGITQADADRLRPFVTIHSGLAAIDMNVAPQALVDVLAHGLRSGGGPSLLESGLSAGGLGATEQRSTLPSQFLAASTRRAFSIRSQARTAGGTTFVRETVLEFVAPNSSVFVLRRWHRGSAAAAPATEALPHC
jgi:general secretion pathway protein K